MLKKYLYKYSYIYEYKGHLNEKNVIFCLIMWKNIWVSCPKTWVSRPKNVGELTKNLGELSKNLGELTNFYLGELVFGWVVLIPYRDSSLMQCSNTLFEWNLHTVYPEQSLFQRRIWRIWRIWINLSLNSL